MEKETELQFQELEHAITAKIAELTDPFQVILGESKGIRAAVDYARLVAVKDTTVLLRGESGTGKEIFARAIHNASLRRAKPFIPVNCGNFPEELLESELFGYEKGAFTGANATGKVGLFESADHGTVFLDEIADVPLQLQAKLLRVLQEKKIRKVGGLAENPIDVRFILATNKKLEAMIEEGLFRKDLYYRINVFPIAIPPLRHRKEDIRILADAFLEIFNRKLGKTIGGFAPGAYEKLKDYSWPGNVRELQNVIERTVILAQGSAVVPQDIEIRDYYAGFSYFGRSTAEHADTLKERLHAIEGEIIAESCRKYGSIRQAAKDLGVSHTSISNKLKRKPRGPEI